jgi:Uma2 family endonuclease
LLAVEVRSPSTALIDLNLKRAAYERHGVASYWILDPDPEKATLLGFELDGAGGYVEAFRVTGEESVTVERPFPMVLTPSVLTAGLRPDG